MEELLKSFVGKQVDISFGANSIVRGDVSEVRDGVLFMEDEDQRAVFISIDKINVVWQIKETHSRPGFVV